MRYPDQPTLLGSLKPAAKEILPMLAVAFTGLVVLVSCFALFMAPAGMKPHDIAIGVKLS